MSKLNSRGRYIADFRLWKMEQVGTDNIFVVKTYREFDFFHIRVMLIYMADMNRAVVNIIRIVPNSCSTGPANHEYHQQRDEACSEPSSVHCSLSLLLVLVLTTTAFILSLACVRHFGPPGHCRIRPQGYGQSSRLPALAMKLNKAFTKSMPILSAIIL